MAMCDKAWEKEEEIGRAHEDIDNKWNFLRSQWIRPQGVGQSVSQSVETQQKPKPLTW